MKRHLLLLTIVFLVARPAVAQIPPSGIPVTEIFAGGSYFRAGVRSGSNLAGWQAAIDYNIFKHTSLVLDFGGQYENFAGTTRSLYQYMGGPRFKYRAGRATAFVHGLVGGDASHIPGSTVGAFAAGAGGGLDINVGRHVAVRVFQVDWISDHSHDVWRQNIRGAFGVVFKLPQAD